MTEPAYRYLLCDLLTDRLLAELPLTGVSFDRRISRVGSLQAKLEAPTPLLVAQGKALRNYAGRAALWVLRDGQVWWGGIPWTVRPRQGQRGPVTLDITAATFDSYAHHRVLRETLTYIQVDQGVLIPELWRHLQADPRGNIGMVAEDQPTGTLRDRTYRGSDLAYYGKLIEDLGDVDGGPEHTVDVYLDANGTRTKRLRVANRLGLATPRAVFQRAARGGGRVLEWDEAADAVDGGTTFQTRGDAANGNVGEDVDPLLSSVHEASDLLGQGWPLLDVVADHAGVSELDTLEGYAQAMRQQDAGAMLTSGYTVQVGTTGWNPNRIGDAVRIKLADEWHDSQDLTVRPVGCTVTAAQAGTPETIKLLFGDE